MHLRSRKLDELQYLCYSEASEKLDLWSLKKSYVVKKKILVMSPVTF